MRAMNENAASNRTMIVVGILTVVCGAVPLLIMLGGLPPSPHESADSAPSWMGWLIGLMFVSAGLMVIARGFWGNTNDNDGTLPPSAPRVARALNDMMAFGITCSLALLFTWVAFGPGTRYFAIGFDGLFFAGPGSNESIGRVAFGCFAVLGWVIAAMMAKALLRRWRQ